MLEKRIHGHLYTHWVIYKSYSNIMIFRYGFGCFVHHFVSHNNGLKNYLKAGLKFAKKNMSTSVGNKKRGNFGTP